MVFVREWQSTQGCPYCFQQTRPTKIAGPWPIARSHGRSIRQKQKCIKALEKRIAHEGRRPELITEVKEAKDALKGLEEGKAAAVQRRATKLLEAGRMIDDVEKVKHDSRESRECRFCPKIGMPSRWVLNSTDVRSHALTLSLTRTP